jgi:hypothetical protein
MKSKVFTKVFIKRYARFGVGVEDYRQLSKSGSIRPKTSNEQQSYIDQRN